MTWAGIATTVVGAGASLYGANKQADAAKKAAQQATPIPYSTQSPWGNVAFDPKTHQAQLSMAQNPFYNMFNALGPASLANAATAPGAYLYGADPELANAYRGLGTEALQSDAASRYGLLTQLGQPEQQRSFNNLQDMLFAQGRLGTSGGGIQQEAWQNAANRADLERQLASQDWAASRAQNRFGAALQSVGSGQAGQMNQYNIGSGSLGGIGNIWNNLLGAANVGLSAGGMNAAPWQAALTQAQAAGAPYQAAYGAAQQGGLFDWLGGKIGGWLGGGNQPMAGGAPVTPNQTGPVQINSGPLNLPQPSYYNF